MNLISLQPSVLSIHPSIHPSNPSIHPLHLCINPSITSMYQSIHYMYISIDISITCIYPFIKLSTSPHLNIINTYRWNQQQYFTPVPLLYMLNDDQLKRYRQRFIEGFELFLHWQTWVLSCFYLH